MFYHHSSVIYFGKILHGRMQEIVTVYAKNCIGRCKISKCQSSFIASRPAQYEPKVNDKFVYHLPLKHFHQYQKGNYSTHHCINNEY